MAKKKSSSSKNYKFGDFLKESKSVGAHLVRVQGKSYKVKGSDETFKTFHRAIRVANRLASQ